MEIKVTKQNYDKEIRNSQGIVLVDFWATWCGPCQMLSPILEEIGNKYKNKIKICKINVDEEQELAEKNKIMSIPSVFIYKDGKLVNNFVGYRSVEEIEELIETI